MNKSFLPKSSRLRFLTLLGMIGLLGCGASFALSSPDSRVDVTEIPEQVNFRSGLMATPDALYQVTTSAGKTRVTVTQGGIFVKSQGQEFDIVTSDGTVSVSNGEAIVNAGGDKMRVEVLVGQASVNSPYIVSNATEVKGPFTLVDGESAETSVLGPEEEEMLSNLGMHESSAALADLEMHEVSEPLGELAMAEFGTVITSLGLSEIAGTSLLAPILGSGAVAAIPAVAAALNRSPVVEPPPISQ